jgi:hypothetical protein
MMPHSGRIYCLIAAGCTVVACASLTRSALTYAFDPHLGPCAGAMDSVEADRGEPSRKYYNDEEDVDTGHVLIQHDWHYTVGRDSVVVVQFSWESEREICEVVEHDG